MPREAGSPSDRRAILEALLGDDHDIAAWLVHDGAVARANASARRLLRRRALDGSGALQLFSQSCRDKARAALSSAAGGTWELQVGGAGAEERAVRFLVVPLDGGDRLLLAATPTAVYSEEASFKLLELNDELANAMRESSQRARQIELARAELEQLGALRDQFIATLSHDLRSPLGAMLLLARLIEQRAQAPSTEELHGYAGRLERSVRRMLELVDGILAQSRLQRGESDLRREPVMLADLAREAVDLQEPIAEHAQVGLAVSSTPSQIVVQADRLAIFQVLSNMISNALRHTARGTTVRVDIREVARRVQCGVEDSGPGVPAEERERIFERFYQAGPRRGSAGLGLSISRQLVELHGGRIWVEPSAGGGARFVFEIPRD
jgi:signal transduction histidine kinase